MNQLLSVFAACTIFGTVLGLSAFHLTFRPLADAMDTYHRIAGAIGGAFLGTFAGAILLLPFGLEVGELVSLYILVAHSTVFAFAMQKFLGDHPFGSK